MLGYCMSCACLKSIQPVSQRWGSRQCEWRPVMHDKTVHVDCGEVVDVDALVCRRCGAVSVEALVTTLCDGHRRDIR
jgi:hypothetical protein